jgi:quinol monooxygenase YgiN
MIVRIVRMHFAPEGLALLREKLLQQAPHVRAFPGCSALTLHEDAEQRGAVYSVSYWQSLEALETYRQSQTFRAFWQEIKPYFVQPPQAFTLSAPLFSF